MDEEESAPHKNDRRISAVGAKYKSMSPARLPISRAPCLTIPPGLSPTTLLDSPVLLTNVKVEPSPTTGTFTIPSIVNRIGYNTAASPIESSDSSSCEEGCSEDFEFRPRSSICSAVDQPPGTLPSTESEQLQHIPNSYVQYGSSVSATSVIKPEAGTLNGMTSSHVTTFHESGNKSVACSEVVSSKVQHLDDLSDGSQAPQLDYKGPDLLSSTDKTSEDGYNWRKYGQKHVKGSEYPRSYYKCTHPNCQVKKQLERSHDGHITDIIYKGKHDHPKPQPSRKVAIGASLSGIEEERNDGSSSSIGVDDKSLIVDDPKRHLCDANRSQGFSPLYDVNCAGSAELAKYDDVVDEDDEDPDAKRRRKENASMDIAAVHKITREPRVVIQTLSEVDILDDGYRWRKYGQKVVKGNPNPRSYYKCTNVGCPVRKHVERASHDPKAVITTYEGKHNHDVPAARTTSHDTAASMTINGGTPIYNCIPLPMAYDGSQATFNHCDDGDSISLDLGVGLSPRQKDGNGRQPQIPTLESVHSMELDPSSSGCGKLVIPSAPSVPYFGVTNNGANYFGPTENAGESFGSMAASVHPDSFKVNLGNLLMGP